ncbi:MAG: V-type ATP synthase subunit K [Spirochaetia bacterium]|jgi:V/A-type H+-transporting ATPase subunit K|nr:V-type ATP synthase subunit K [Spirochaetia bacterium]
MNMGQMGIAAAFALAAAGSAIGIGIAGMSTIGAWKKCYAQNKPAPFILLAFVGAPFTQTIYGMILMNQLKAASATADPGLILGAGLFGGIGIGMSAWFQGSAGAAGADALTSTGKGFSNYLIILGLVESVALFVMVFLMGIL